MSGKKCGNSAICCKKVLVLLVCLFCVVIVVMCVHFFFNIPYKYVEKIGNKFYKARNFVIIL